MRYALCAGFILGVAACATTSVPDVTPGAKSATWILDPAAATPRTGAGIIVITWAEGHTTSACTLDISIDGKLAAGLLGGEQVTLYVAPGERIISVSVRQRAFCPSELAQIAVNVSEGVTKKLRTGFDSSFDLRLEPSAY